MKAPDPTSIQYFEQPEDFRRWLAENANTKDELFVGFYKKATKLASITWPESVDEALCYGWIDGIRRSLGEKSYCIRFTPRRAGSHWSAVNIARMAVLKKAGRVQTEGLAAFKKRKTGNTGKAAYEQKNVQLDPAYEKQFKSSEKAWDFFNSKPPSYRKQCIWWIMSAKLAATRQRRLGILIDSSTVGMVIPPLRWTVPENKKK